MNQEFTLKKIINVIRNYLIEEINQNELTSKKHKKICRVWNYIEHSLIIISTTSGCVSIPAFASLNAILIGITSSAMGVTISVITAEIKKYNSVKKKKRKRHDKIVLLAKSKLNSIDFLIFKFLIDSNISHEEFILLNNGLKEFYDMKDEIKNYIDK